MKTLPIITALALALAAMPAQAADTPAVDLVSKIIIGGFDNAMMSFGNGVEGVVEHPEAGIFVLEAPSARSIDFYTVEKSHCVFDILVSVAGASYGGIEIDANKLTGADVTVVGTKAKWTDFSVVLKGPDGVQQDISPDGTLAGNSTVPNTFSSSITEADVKQAVADLQAYCKAT